MFRAPVPSAGSLKQIIVEDPYARHRQAVTRPDEYDLATAAFSDRELANAVARQKTVFLAEKATERSQMDRAAAVNGGLRCGPGGDGRKALAEDHSRMIDGLFLDRAEPFDALIVRCAGITASAHGTANKEEKG